MDRVEDHVLTIMAAWMPCDDLAAAADHDLIDVMSETCLWHDATDPDVTVAVGDRHRVIVGLVAHQRLGADPSGGLITGIERGRREFGHLRNVPCEALTDGRFPRYRAPAPYRRTAPIKRPKLEGFTEIIDGWLEDDLGVHRKQRHTAKRVFERLRDEHGFTGGYTIVKDYMRQRERRGREMFVPLAHPPGHAQADFGEAVVIIGGVEQKAHFFVLDLPHSDACFVRAYPAATAEAWMDGHVHAFAFFGGVPLSVLYDNDRCLVSKILADGTRQRASLFSALQSHYLFHDRYGRPGKGNDKGNAEGLVGFSRRNFMVPIPQFATWDAFNAYLEEQCRKRQADTLRGQSEKRSAGPAPFCLRRPSPQPIRQGVQATPRPRNAHGQADGRTDRA